MAYKSICLLAHRIVRRRPHRRPSIRETCTTLIIPDVRSYPVDQSSHAFSRPHHAGGRNRLSVLLDLTVAQTRSDVNDWSLVQSVFEPVTFTQEVVGLLGAPLAQRIEVAFSRLRKKLEAALAGESPIRSARGRGYVFAAPIVIT